MTMLMLSIQGGYQLQGTVKVNGSKNASLPIMFATLLLDAPCVLHNIPALRDTYTTFALLEGFGFQTAYDPISHTLRCIPNIKNTVASYELVKTMRASILCLGPLLAQCKKAQVSLPGGCAIGARPVAMHLDALAKMGVAYTLEDGYILAETNGLQGATITFPFPTVGGTENLIMAAVKAKGTTVLHNAAQEPEIVDLANFLIQAGAHIEGHGTDTITIEGVERLQLTEYTIMPDRIEAGTLMVAAAMTKGDVTLEQCPIDTLGCVLDVMESMGVAFEKKGATTLRIAYTKPLQGIEIETSPYPFFPTDMQAQIMALTCLATTPSSISETIFENRFMHVPELNRMGANITVHGHTATIQGNTCFQGTHVMASDLRASASLVLAGLVARGTTDVERIYHLDRGYEQLENKLNALGARIKRVKEE